MKKITTFGIALGIAVVSAGAATAQVKFGVGGPITVDHTFYFANVEQAATNGALPVPVRQAAADVLALRVPLGETITAADVKQAFVRSGVLLEPQLAAARTATADAPTVPHARGSPGGRRDAGTPG